MMHVYYMHTYYPFTSIIYLKLDRLEWKERGEEREREKYREHISEGKKERDSETH